MSALIIALLLSQSGGTNSAATTNYAGPRVTAGSEVNPFLPLFEFAPASGAGMSAACACSAVTGAYGETMTFVRTSSGTCLTGGTVSGIANGSMSTCAANLPRVMPGGDGSSAVMGVLLENAKTNSALRSEEFDSALVWVPSNSGGTGVTVTANAAVAPDGTTTADRIQIAARSSGWALLQQAGVGGAGAASASVFARGNGQSGVFHLTIDNTGPGGTCVVCTYVTGSWTRCVAENLLRAATWTLSVGIDPNDCGGGSFAAQDFFIWGGQGEVGAYATSYIPTTSAAVARSSERMTRLNFSLAFTGSLSHAVTYLAPPVFPATANARPLGVIYLDASNYLDSYMPDSTSHEWWQIAGVTKSDTASPALTVSAVNRIYGFFDGTTVSSCANGSCNTTASTFSPFTGTVDLCLGAFGADCAVGPYAPDGVLKEYCMDLSSNRCR